MRLMSYDKPLKNSNRCDINFKFQKKINVNKIHVLVSLVGEHSQNQFCASSGTLMV